VPEGAGPAVLCSPRDQMLGLLAEVRRAPGRLDQALGSSLPDSKLDEAFLEPALVGGHTLQVSAERKPVAVDGVRHTFRIGHCFPADIGAEAQSVCGLSEVAQRMVPDDGVPSR
jgi:hypothetical protein